MTASVFDLFKVGIGPSSGVGADRAGGPHPGRADPRATGPAVQEVYRTRRLACRGVR